MLSKHKDLFSEYLYKAFRCAGIFEKVGNKFKVPIPELVDKTFFGKAIGKNPDKFYTPEIMEMINDWTMENFTYGSSEEEYDDGTDETD